jgi:CDP-diacylglycerol--glycerol-3-phosphate 3-phosphatidyltransferase
MQSAGSGKPETLSDYARFYLKDYADAVAGFLNRLGLRPNTVTFLGLLGHFLAAYLVIRGFLAWAGVVTLFSGLFDFLDGSMARLRGESSSYGAFVDSVTDRYSEFVLFFALMFYFYQQQNLFSCIGVTLAVIGSVMVSYVRARGESLGYSVKIGILSRLERYIVLVPGLLFNIPAIAVWIIGVLANFTALQRIAHVRRQACAQRSLQE